MAYHVIIPAAGSGTRMGAQTPKQYLPLNGKALIQHVIDLFTRSNEIQSVHVVLSQGDNTHFEIEPAFKHKLFVHDCGGETRSNTVLNGLHAIAESVNVAADDWVLVHDAARPGLSDILLNALIATIQDDAVGGLLALPVADTLKRADAAQHVAATIPRADLWQAQTPQMFRYATLVKALTHFVGTPTDEAEAIEALGLKPILVTGALRNLKVTYPQDLAVLSALMQLKD
jgi:2-C-methyl-D-erythritol 4-phosphate cytidylyltransferase